MLKSYYLGDEVYLETNIFGFKYANAFRNLELATHFM